MSPRRMTRAGTLLLAGVLAGCTDSKDSVAPHAPDGALPAPMTPASYGARIKSDYAQWKRIASERNIVIE